MPTLNIFQECEVEGTRHDCQSILAGMMKIVEAFQLQNKMSCMVAFVGAGGKTTCMFRFAEELKALGMRVIVSTTTKIRYPEASLYDRLVIQSRPEDVLQQIISAAPGTVTVVAKKLLEGTGKLKGFAPKFFDRLLYGGFADYILVEADGSQNKPVKAPGEHEPVIPESADIVIGLTGFDCYEKSITRQNVFRLDEFCEVSGKSVGEKIDVEALQNLVRSRGGLFKTAPTSAQRVWILNKVDDSEALIIAEQVSEYIFSHTFNFDVAILSALNQNEPIKKILRRNSLSRFRLDDAIPEETFN